MADEIIRLDYSAEDIGDNIDEVRTARGEYDSLDERLDEIEGGGFTPTQAQLDAINSGITDDDVEQIDLNKNNISSLRAYGGLKNYATINNGTYTANSGGGTHSTTIPLLSPITGDIVISIGNITSNDVDSSTCAFVFKNDITSQGTVAVSRGDNINVPVSMGTFVATMVEIYPAATYQTSNGDTVSWTDLMICTKEDWDNSHDYQPYALPNTTITPVLKECVDNGVKNLLSYTLADIKSYNSNGVSWNGNVCTVGNLIFTINSDMSVTVSGSQGTGSAYLVLAKNVSYPAIRFQGCPAGGGSSTYQLQAYYSSAPTTSANDNGTGVSVVANTWSEICITIRPNQTFSNPITFKPMAIPQSIYDAGFTDYQPYAMSNAEITAWILAHS